MEIHTENLLIREIENDDFEEVHKFASKEEVCRYQVWGPNSIEDTRSYILNASNERHTSPRLNYNLVVYSLKEKRVIGTCGIYLKENNISEIGFTIGNDFWGKGVGTSVAKALVDFSFIDLKLHKVIATCDVLNEGSRALLEKVGFKQANLIKNHMNIRGRSRDTLFYELKK
jgi:ribosomal-protein-alanine N-acetyltransferase